MPVTDKTGHRPNDDAYTKRRLVTMRDQDVELIDRAADYVGMPVSVFIRNAAIVAAREALKEAQAKP